MTLRAPEPLTQQHDCSGFDCGSPSLNLWLVQRALPNRARGVSRCFVVRDAERVVAYSALASGAVAARMATGRFRRNMPDPIPVVLLARLAVDRAYQGRGVSRHLVKDAGRRTAIAADTIGMRGLLVQALDDAARGLYQHLGFSPSPLDPRTLMILLCDLRALLKD